MRSRHLSRNFWSSSESVCCSRWASRNTWHLSLIPCCSAMRQSFKSLADGDDEMSLIGATASMWAKVEICRMECVTMNTSVTRSLAIIASRSRSLTWRSHACWILELCAGLRVDGPAVLGYQMHLRVLGQLSQAVLCPKLLINVCTHVDRRAHSLAPTNCVTGLPGWPADTSSIHMTWRLCPCAPIATCGCQMHVRCAWSLSLLERFAPYSLLSKHIVLCYLHVYCWFHMKVYTTLYIMTILCLGNDVWMHEFVVPGAQSAAFLMFGLSIMKSKSAASLFVFFLPRPAR